MKKMLVLLLVVIVLYTTQFAFAQSCQWAKEDT